MKPLLCDELADPVEARMRREDLLGAVIVMVADANGAHNAVRAHPELARRLPNLLRGLADELERRSGN